MQDPVSKHPNLPVLRTFTITFHAIMCERPSTGIVIRATKAAEVAGNMAKEIGSSAQAVVGHAGPEAQAAAVVVKVAGTITSATAKIVRAFDGKLRDKGLLPDHFYISQTSTKDPVSGELRSDQVLWPKAGKNPKEHNVKLASGEEVRGMPLRFEVQEGRSVVLWDWDHGNNKRPVRDEVTRDDVLLQFRIGDKSVGRHACAYYNAKQDCSYYVDWELRLA